MHLHIGNKLYSSWSLRPWLAMRAFGVAFEETVYPLHMPDTKGRLLDVNPAGKVPCLVDGPVKVWESLAIIEYVAEAFPEKGIWPRDRAARAHARSLSAEMHAGFQGLRGACPMHLGKRFMPREDLGSDVADNVRRFEGLVSDARRRFGAGGDFLFGAFTGVDAMFAPLATRLDTYQIRLAPQTRAYVDAILAHPAFLDWKREALQEPWGIPHYEAGWTTAETFHTPSILAAPPRANA